MSGVTSQLAPRLTKKDRRYGPAFGSKADEFFFDLYSRVEALTKVSRKPGEATRLFHSSKRILEQELRYIYAQKELDDANLDIAASHHAVLALVHWLYPNYIGYNRLRNARMMYQHAVAAVATSKSKTSISGVIGLVVQLRITPFLIRSRKSSEENLAGARRAALNLFSNAQNDDPGYLNGLLGMLYDGVGFSYFLFERDTSSALTYLTKAVSCLSSSLREVSASAKTQSGLFKAFAAAAYWDLGICYEGMAEKAEGEEMLGLAKRARARYQTSLDFAKETSWHIYKGMSAYNLSGTYFKEAENHMEKRRKAELLRKAVSLGEESLKWFSLWSTFEGDFLGGSWVASFYQNLANYSSASAKRKLMARSLELAKKADELVNNRKVGLVRYKAVNLGDIFYHNSEYYRQLALEKRFRSGGTREMSERDESKGVELLEKSLSNCLKSRTYYGDKAFYNRKIDSAILAGDLCYELMNCKTASDLDGRRYASDAKRYFSDAMKISKELGLNERIAASSWRIAQLFDKEGKYEQSSSQYMQAHEAYELARAASESSSAMYSDPSNYMLAWHGIEKAKVAHRASEFERASDLYREASSLIRGARRWKSRSHFYTAESLIEKAEKESFGENVKTSIDYFDKATQSLEKLQSELRADDSDDSISFLRLGAKLRQFCSARIILERSKEAYRVGNTEQSVKMLAKADAMFSELSESSSLSDSMEANELESLASLCDGLKNMQSAQAGKDSKLYLDARDVFEKAALKSTSRSLKPLLSGLASFATFLYYSKEIEESLVSELNVEHLVECNKALDSAAITFRKLGNRSFLNMLKASKQILNATISMSAAEREMESEAEKSRLYTKAQRSLSLASKYYEQLGSSARVKESLRLMAAVKHHKGLIPLANDIITEIASNQIIYTAISSASMFDQSPENSARELDSAYLVFDLSIPKPVMSLADKTMPLSLAISNIGKQAAITVRIDEMLPEGFELVSDGKYSVSKNNALSLKAKVEPGSTKNVAITAKALAAGEFIWSPALVYMDDAGNYKIAKAQMAKVVVESENLTDIASILSTKEKLTAELKALEEKAAATDGTSPTTQEDMIFSVKKKISEIEEGLMRSKNECEKLTSQLEQVRADLSSLDSMQDEALKTEEKTKLENEEKLILARLERRRPLLEQLQ